LQIEGCIEEVISHRNLWHSFWLERAGINIQEGNESHSFQIDVTLLLIFTDIIGTILFQYFNPEWHGEKDPNAKLLRKAYSLALEWKRKEFEARNVLESMEGYTISLTHLKEIATKKEFPKRMSRSYITASLARVWKHIISLIKSLETKSLNKNFFNEDGSYNLSRCIQTTFNIIFLQSIHKLNERLIKCQERFPGKFCHFPLNPSACCKENAQEGENLK
jgi:hypothetical protein